MMAATPERLRTCPWIGPHMHPKQAVRKAAMPRGRWIDTQPAGSYDDAEEALREYRLGGLPEVPETSEDHVIPASARVAGWFQKHWNAPTMDPASFADQVFDALRERMIVALADGTRATARIIGIRCAATGEQIATVLRREREVKLGIIAAAKLSQMQQMQEGVA